MGFDVRPADKEWSTHRDILRSKLQRHNLELNGLEEGQFGRIYQHENKKTSYEVGSKTLRGTIDVFKHFKEQRELSGAGTSAGASTLANGFRLQEDEDEHTAPARTEAGAGAAARAGAVPAAASPAGMRSVCSSAERGTLLHSVLPADASKAAAAAAATSTAASAAAAAVSGAHQEQPLPKRPAERSPAHDALKRLKQLPAASASTPAAHQLPAPAVPSSAQQSGSDLLSGPSSAAAGGVLLPGAAAAGAALPVALPDEVVLPQLLPEQQQEQQQEIQQPQPQQDEQLPQQPQAQQTARKAVQLWSATTGLSLQPQQLQQLQGTDPPALLELMDLCLAAASAQGALDSARAAEAACISSCSSVQTQEWRALQAAGAAMLAKARGAYEGAQHALDAVCEVMAQQVLAAVTARNAAAAMTAVHAALLAMKAHPDSMQQPTSEQAGYLQHAASVLQAQDVGSYLLGWMLHLYLKTCINCMPPEVLPTLLRLCREVDVLLLSVWLAAKAEGARMCSASCLAIAQHLQREVDEVMELDVWVAQHANLYQGYAAFLEQLGLAGLGLSVTD